MFEVAHLAGVSHQTVSRVINSSPAVSPATRAKVLAVIKQLGYRPSNPARALASHRSRTVGLIAGGVRFFGPISAISSIEVVARSHGLFVAVTMVDEARCSRRDFEQLCGTFIEQNVDAFIFITPTDRMLSAACHAKIDQPRVVITATHGASGIARVPDSGRVAFVGIDQWGAMRDMVMLLWEMGHRSVTYLAGPREWRDACTRLVAWTQLCGRLGIATRVIQTLTWDAAEAYAVVNHLIEHCGQNGIALPTALITADDNQAIGAMRALHEHGLHIPQDISVAGFDDMASVDNLFPPLTTVRPHFEQLGTVAMEEVLALLNGGQRPVLPKHWHGVGLIPATLMRRSSLGPASRH